MMYYGPGMSGWGMALMVLGNVFFWGLLVLAAVTVARYARRDGVGSSRPAEAPPQQVLAVRFARGEIDEDEYLRRLHILSGTSAQPPLR